MDDIPHDGQGSGQARRLALNGALLMLTGLVCGLAISAAPYPRLMLAAHIQFLVNGMVSVLAALLLETSMSVVEHRGGTVILWGHVATWAVCLSEVAGAFWGTTRTLPIAGGQAGAPGAASWQEFLVMVCHVIPALLLLAAWVVIVLGFFRRRPAPS